MEIPSRCLIVDIEATCWDTRPPDNQYAEIIEIGVAEVDTVHAKIIENSHIYVRPENSEISAFCTELTGITTAEVAQGVSLEEACLWLESRFQSSNKMWMSFGDYDKYQFKKECKQKRIKYPFSSFHLNIKFLVAFAENWTKALGMKATVEALGLDFVGKHHSGKDDAYNIAQILCHILKKYRS